MPSRPAILAGSSVSSGLASTSFQGAVAFSRERLQCCASVGPATVIAVAPETAGAVLDHARAAGFAQAAVIGGLRGGAGIEVV